MNAEIRCRGKWDANRNDLQTDKVLEPKKFQREVKEPLLTEKVSESTKLHSTSY